MKAVKARVTKGLHIGSFLNVADNSGAKLVRIVAVHGTRGKTRRGRQISCGVADLIKISVRQGPLELKKQLHYAVIVRQRRPYRRLTGELVAFEDNACVLLKDDKGNPAGTIIKGPIAREVAERWPFVAKIASIIL
ncbi:MAG: uL14 family ribosomal protein [Candidatus Pacearchaeota archaeon]